MIYLKQCSGKMDWTNLITMIVGVLIWEAFLRNWIIKEKK